MARDDVTDRARNMHAKTILDSCYVGYVLCITFKTKLSHVKRCWCWGRATQRRQVIQYDDLTASSFPKYPVLSICSCNHQKILAGAASLSAMLEVLSWISLTRRTLLRIKSTLLSAREDTILKLSIVLSCTKQMLRHLQSSGWDPFKADPSSTWVLLFHA